LSIAAEDLYHNDFQSFIKSQQGARQAPHNNEQDKVESALHRGICMRLLKLAQVMLPVWQGTDSRRMEASSCPAFIKQGD